MMNSKFLLAILAIAMLILASGCVSVVKESDDGSDEGGDATELDDFDSNADDGSSADEGLEDGGDDFAEDDSTEGEDMPTKTVLEGELVEFPNLKATDPDGDEITYTFTGPLDDSGEWQTEVGDAGRYTVTITASDGENEVSQDVLVIVKSLNNPPVIEELDNVEIDEGDTVSLNPVVTDPDNDEVEVEFSGWMTSSTKKTASGDAGEHTVTITASDGKETASTTVSIKVNKVNRAPQIDSLSDITVDEGDTVSVSVTASDPDGDDVEVSFSEPLDANGEWDTEMGDAGKYLVKVTASDGEADAEDSFYITVKSLNAAPVLEGVADIEVDEGELIVLSITATDAEGDDVEITFSAPFDDEGTWQTGYDDEGEYVATVTASDGISETKESFDVVVNDVNRPPAFGEGAFE